jgi:hypothetical protein
MFPVPGDTNVQGQIEWQQSTGAGVVVAYASLYGTPDPLVYFYANPLRFAFQSNTSFQEGQNVLFDIAVGPYNSYATNVAAA